MSNLSTALPALAVSALASVGFSQAVPRIAPPSTPQADVKTAPDNSSAPTLTNEALRVPNDSAVSAGEVDVTKAPSAPTSSLKGIDFSIVRYQDGSDGSLWARGRTYKARFDPTSATVIPYFSARAPRNFDVRFELESVSAGGATLAFDPRASVHRNDDVVTLDRGAVDEQYVLGVDQLEQRFVLESLPGVGALTLRMAVRSELVGSSGARGFAFENEWGALNYGLATAIDARGATLPLESRLVDGNIEIVVPASFAASAVLPLTIDPVISIFGVDVNSTTAFSGDSSYDLSAGAVLHVYNVVYSATDWDVGGYATDRVGNVWAGSFFWNDFSSAHWVRPRIAHNGATDRFLVCAQVGQPGGRAIWGQVRTVFNNSLMAPALLSGPEIGEKINVDVGGDTYPALPSYFGLVYERVLSTSDHDIHARLIDTNGVPVASPGTIFVDNTSATLDAYPTISKSNQGDAWNLAWQRDVTGQPTRVFAARVLWSGGVVAPTFAVSNTNLSERRPSVSSSLFGTNKFMVACERDFVSDNDIQLYAVDHNVAPTSYNLSATDGASLFNDQREPSIDSDGHHFMVGFAEYLNVNSGWDVYASEAQWAAPGISVRQHRMALATTSANEGEVQIVAAASSKPTEGYADYSAIYNRGIHATTAGPTDDVFSALVEGTYGGLIANFCTKTEVSCPCGVGFGPGGCPNSVFTSGAHMSAYGRSRTTEGSLAFGVTGLKPNATALVFQGTGTINLGFGNPLGDGVRCVGGFITRFTPAPSDATGFLAFPPIGQPPIAQQGAVPFMGGFYYYQTWYRDTGVFCTSEMTNLSDGVMVEWTP